MVSLRKVEGIRIGPDSDLRTRLGESTADANIARIMLKDAHLIEAALSADQIVVSLDNTVRGHFSRVSTQVDELREILWVDPNEKPAQVISWLEGGAKHEKQRRLGYQPG